MKKRLFVEFVAFLLLTTRLNAQEYSPGEYITRGKTHYENKRYDEAIAEYNKALALNHRQMQVYCLIGEATSGKGNWWEKRPVR